ncbi:hypothetical protein NLI96_g11861 [Meripilus lineatus]|uniref:DNA 3'-5' helicase n=1 Tax=Meripilus lineatus TaxID=2056292 RepID=A0AAD5UQZ0_9APHY|nr:hypothetical protein NLI96_g11861 [Physisporinus lineatus]
MATKYQKLSSQDVLDLMAAMKKNFQWEKEPRAFQVKAVQAQLEGMDIVIQAPTGAGKTAIAAGPHVWPTMKGRITIMISPLLALETEMVDTFRVKYGLRAICVNSENGGCTRAVQKQLLSGSIQVLLVSPEMLLSKIFTEKLLRQTKFTQKVGSVVIDEAHCISHWGSDFRKKYGEIGTLRAFLSPKIPFVAMSATLTPRVCRDIFSILHFSKGEYRFINIGNNRPNVSIAVRSCRHPLNSFQDLDFIFPSTIQSLSDILKTWIYVDNITEGEKMADYLSALLESRNLHLHDAYNAIRPYNARLPPEYRTAAMEAFRKGEIRVLICTEAAGMGCDIPDIDLVIQWQVPATLSHLVQRAGRVARGAGHIGMALLLVE